MAIVFVSGTALAQSDSLFASQRALLFADSLLRSYHDSDLTSYTDLSYPGVIEYYGGRKNFVQYVNRSKAIQAAELREEVRLVQLVSNAVEWQCVVQKVSENIVDNRKASIITYLIGQSTDNGRSWTFFDVATNPVRNVSDIMPDVFDTLIIPQREVVFVHTTTQARYQQDPIQPARL